MKKKSDELTQLPADYLERHTKVFADGLHHILLVDPSLRNIILTSDFPLFLSSRHDDVNNMQELFLNLANSIISQQISGAAADSIKKKIMRVYNDKFPTYQELYSLCLDKNEQMLRVCGLSRRKISYIKSLSDYFYNNEQALQILFSDPDDQKIEDELTKNIKGIGPWTAKMFLIIGLKRMNVFAVNDLGIAKGCSRYLDSRNDIVNQLVSNRVTIKKSRIKHKHKLWKIYDEDIIESCGFLFSPYRTIFMFILWRLSNTNLDAMIKNEKKFVYR